MMLICLDWPMLANERPATFGTAGTSAGRPPSNLSDIVALSFTLIVLRSNDAVNVAAGDVEVNPPTASRVRSVRHHETFHEPNVWSPGFSRSGSPEGGTPNKRRPSDRFMGPMHAQKRKGAFHEPQFPNPNNE